MPFKKIKYVCCLCKENKYRVGKYNDGYVCRKCWDFFFRKSEFCDVCGEFRAIGKVIKTLRICTKCTAAINSIRYEKYIHSNGLCVSCKKVKKIKNKKLSMCGPCLYKRNNIRTCIVCNVSKKFRCFKKGTNVCKDCYSDILNEEKCYKCGKIVNRTIRNLCSSCYQMSEYKKCKCDICGETKRKIANIDNKTYCYTCYENFRYKNDQFFNVKKRLSHRLREAFKKFSKNGKVGKSKDYNIDYQKIFEYIGPCPGNREDYHIDHIIPLSSFDFNDPKQVELAFLPENHQWLTAEDNLKKNSKIFYRYSSRQFPYL